MLYLLFYLQGLLLSLIVASVVVILADYDILKASLNESGLKLKNIIKEIISFSLLSWIGIIIFACVCIKIVKEIKNE